MPRVNIELLPHYDNNWDLPAYQTQGAAGVDLRAAIDAPLTLQPLARHLIPCGFKLALPKKHEAQIRPRSGLALNHGITVLNAPGTIDEDYRGEVMVLLINLSHDPFIIHRGDRMAQMIIAPVVQAKFDKVDMLEITTRGVQGFGSTGKR